MSALSAATDLPLSVDSERLFADDLEGVAATVRRLAQAGAAGCSIEDWNPATQQIEERGWAAERVAAAAAAAHEGDPMVLTARAENLLHGQDDLDDTIGRLVAYREAGADVVYAPGVTDPAPISALVEAAGAPVNVLALPDAPDVGGLRGPRRAPRVDRVAAGRRGVRCAGGRRPAAPGPTGAPTRRVRGSPRTTGPASSPEAAQGSRRSRSTSTRS